jgi:hypothetical protein
MRLEEMRLKRVGENLLCVELLETITTVALLWGFTHLASFSWLYRASFDEFSVFKS